MAGDEPRLRRIDAIAGANSFVAACASITRGDLRTDAGLAVDAVGGFAAAACATAARAARVTGRSTIEGGVCLDEAFSIPRLAGDAIDDPEGIFEQVLKRIVGIGHGGVLSVEVDIEIPSPRCDEVSPN